MRYFFAILALTQTLFCGKIHYDFVSEPIDVVIPCAPSDRDTLNLCIDGIRKNGMDIRRIIVVSPKKLSEKAEWYDEANFPFDKWSIAKTLFNGDEEEAEKHLRGPNRVGWIYQQLLKLYAAYVIPDISSNILVLDADTIFLHPISFRDKNGFPYFATSGEYHEPYFSHMKNLIPWLKRQQPYSGIVHHMLFQKPVLDDLFHTIEELHQKPAWEALISCITELYWACLSEYEIYFNFIFAKSNQPQLRHLFWRNSGSLKKLNRYRDDGYAYVSFHKWMRKN